MREAPRVGGSHEAPERRPSNRRSTTTSNKLTHTAYIVTPAKGDDRKGQWHEIGAVWPHKNGSGFDLVIPAGISVSGRIVCTERKESAAP